MTDTIIRKTNADSKSRRSDLERLPGCQQRRETCATLGP